MSPPFFPLLLPAHLMYLPSIPPMTPSTPRLIACFSLLLLCIYACVCPYIYLLSMYIQQLNLFLFCDKWFFSFLKDANASGDGCVFILLQRAIWLSLGLPGDHCSYSLSTANPYTTMHILTDTLHYLFIHNRWWRPGHCHIVVYYLQVKNPCLSVWVCSI